MDVGGTNLRPITLSETFGMRPLQMLRSKVSLCFSGRRPVKSENRKRTTAITSCVHKKKSGVEVLKSTHLFLQIAGESIALQAAFF